jgi:hypothetical protein
VTYAFTIDMPGSLELYRTAHAEFNKFPTHEMLLHLARPTDGGVQIVEVWTSAEAFESWMATSVGAAIGAVEAAGMAFPEVTPVPFDPAGLILPTAGIAV